MIDLSNNLNLKLIKHPEMLHEHNKERLKFENANYDFLPVKLVNKCTCINLFQRSKTIFEYTFKCDVFLEHPVVKNYWSE